MVRGAPASMGTPLTIGPCGPMGPLTTGGPLFLPVTVLRSFQRRGQSPAHGGEVGHLGYGGAVGIESHFVKLAEGPFQRGERPVHFLQRHVRHAGVEDHGRRQGEGIGGKEIKILFLAVLEDREVSRQQAR